MSIGKLLRQQWNMFYVLRMIKCILSLDFTHYLIKAWNEIELVAFWHWILSYYLCSASTTDWRFQHWHFLPFLYTQNYMSLSCLTLFSISKSLVQKKNLAATQKMLLSSEIWKVPSTKEVDWIKFTW